jgi:hypothetical protein
MTDQAEPEDRPLCQPQADCPSCGQPYDVRPGICPGCWDLYNELETAARYSGRYEVTWPANFALAALDLGEEGQRRAAQVYAALGYIDPRETPEATLQALLTEGAKPPPEPPRARHEWVLASPAPDADDEWAIDLGLEDRPGQYRCARCGEIRSHYRRPWPSRDW